MAHIREIEKKIIELALEEADIDSGKKVIITNDFDDRFPGANDEDIFDSAQYLLNFGYVEGEALDPIQGKGDYAQKTIKITRVTDKGKDEYID